MGCSASKYASAQEVNAEDSKREVVGDVASKGLVAFLDGMMTNFDKDRAIRPGLPDDFGSSPLDLAKLPECAVLKGVWDAFPASVKVTSEEASVKHLIAASVPFASAPNPQSLFDSMAGRHNKLEPLDETSLQLKLLTFNCGLLSRSHLGGHVCVPDYITRREHTWLVLFGRGDDILLLTEVFEIVDVKAAEEEAAKKGYIIYAGAENREWHGMAIAIHKSCIDEQRSQKKEQIFFKAEYSTEFSPGPSLKRGFLSWQFVHPGGRKMCAICAHCTAFADFVVIRTLQFRQLGLFIRGLDEEHTVWAGGDSNAGTYYPKDDWTAAKVIVKDKTKPEVEGNIEEVKPKEYSSYWECATSYQLFIHYSGAVDLMSCLAAAKDVEVMNKIKSDYTNAYKMPYGMQDFAKIVGTDTLTATDGNSLHFKNYGSNCYQAGRYDYLFVRDNRNLTRVVSAGLTLKEEKKEYTKDAQPVTLSDHFGMEATVCFDNVLST